MSTKRTSRFAIVALTAVAPFALAASAFAADNAMGSAPINKPAISDNATAGNKDLHAKDSKETTKPADAKNGAVDSKSSTVDKHGALDSKTSTDIHAATPADTAKSGTAKSGGSGNATDRTTGSGSSSNSVTTGSGLNGGANVTSGAKAGGNVAPSVNPAGH